MTNQSFAYDDWELDYTVDFRSIDVPVNERLFTSSCPRSSQERFATQERYRRRGGNSSSGMHRRGTRRNSM